VRAEPSASQGKAKYPLGEIDSSRYYKYLTVFHPEANELDELLDKARGSIPGLTDAAAVRSVMEHDPGCIWAISRNRKFNKEKRVAKGFVALLYLNKVGVYRLAAGTLNTANPGPDVLARADERPAGLYSWAVYAPGILAAGVPMVMGKLDTARLSGVDLYSRPNTADGVRFNETLGLKKGAKIGPIYAPNIFVFRRGHKPLYDSYKGNAGGRELTVTVARTFEDLMRVASLRSAVFLSEQECPYEEEFDGNDLSATHFIGYVGDEPAGCLRVRFFADFAKLERLAVRKEFRRTRMSFQLVNAGIEFCQMKGYRRLYGHAQKRLVKFWSRFGFRQFEGGRDLVFSDFDYVEMVAEIDRHPDAITIGADPYVMIRPEGRWHEPGVLERSSAREVTRPSVASA
jgi:predicted GNAT family N-acyltransferase